MQVAEEDYTLGLKLQVFLLLTYFSYVISQRQLEKKMVCKVYNGTATVVLYIATLCTCIGAICTHPLCACCYSF